MKKRSKTSAYFYVPPCLGLAMWCHICERDYAHNALVEAGSIFFAAWAILAAFRIFGTWVNEQ